MARAAHLRRLALFLKGRLATAGVLDRTYILSLCDWGAVPARQQAEAFAAEASAYAKKSPRRGERALIWRFTHGLLRFWRTGIHTPDVIPSEVMWQQTSGELTRCVRAAFARKLKMLEALTGKCDGVVLLLQNALPTEGLEELAPVLKRAPETSSFHTVGLISGGTLWIAHTCEASWASQVPR